LTLTDGKERRLKFSETSNPKTLVQSFTIVGNGAPPPDVVRTQIMQVAYYLRSEMRQNKVAMLFEMLS
jgi:hypothetical protein